MKEGCGLVQDGQGVSWAKAPERPFYCEFHDIAPSAPYAWKLTNKKSKACMMEVIDFVPEQHHRLGRGALRLRGGVRAL